jgi:FlaA1/EpsC-like NDP-sugar epimerase
MGLLHTLLPSKHAPRSIVLGIDMGMAAVALFGAAMLRFEFFIPLNEWAILLDFLPIFLIGRFCAFALFRTSAGIIRHTGISDARRILLANSSATSLFATANVLNALWTEGLYLIPFSILGIEWLLTNGAMITSRLLMKWLYLQNRKIPGIQSQVVIFGAGEAGIIAKQAIDRELGENRMRIVAFIDDAPTKIGKKLDGIDILSSLEANQLFATGQIDRLILSVQSLSPERRQDVVDMALRHGVRPLDVPPVDRWINGELSVKQIRELRIEDLLGRDTIQLNQQDAFASMEGKRIVITGAAGSIGSELVRQVLIHKPLSVLAIDQAETPMHDLHLELKKLGILDRVQLQIGDVRDREQMVRTMEVFQPELVFHAAAYKHVPLMEAQPWQAFETNVMGTYNTLTASQLAGCDRFVLISTDKAVNPTSVMGATKRLAEKVVRFQGNLHSTRCIITRFGNVLGSNGSVIPLFRQQIESGGPITVTDAEVTRYFMTIPEAVSLVIEAGAMGTGDDLFVFDMGESIRILDLAHKMVALAGLEVGRDIEVKITGLRPGEKLHEELLSARESLLATHHPKIMRAQTEAHMLEAHMAHLHVLLNQRGDHKATLDLLQSLLPEYRPDVPSALPTAQEADSMLS